MKDKKLFVIPIILLIIMLTPFIKADLEDGLVAYYNFQQSGGTLVDVHTGTHNATANGGWVNKADGIINAGWNNTRTPAEINITDSPDFDFANETTFSFWVNFTSIPSSLNIYNKRDGNSSYRFLINDTTPANSFYWQVWESDGTFEDVGFPITATPAYIGAWTHVAAVANSSNLVLYINGVEKNKTTYDGTILTSDVNISLGGVGSPLTMLNGTIDEVGIWNRGLSRSEVSILHSGVDFLSDIDVDLISPINGISVTNTTQILFANSSFGGKTLLGVTTEFFVYYENGTLFNSTFSNERINGSATPIYEPSFFVSVNMSNLVPGNTFLWNAQTCGINLTFISECSMSPINQTFLLSTFEQTGLEWSETSYDTDIAPFYINLSYDNLAYEEITGTLIYNGTRYSSQRTGTGSDLRFRSFVSIPIAMSTYNISSYWEIKTTQLDVEQFSNSTFMNQTVLPSNLSSCDNGAVAVNFTTYDEKNLNRLNTDFDAKFSWKLNQSSKVSKNLSVSLNGDNYPFCINANQTFYTDIDIVLTNDTLYNERQFGFNEQSYNNTPTNIDLYLLNSTFGTNVALLLKDTGLTPLQGYTIQIYREVASTGEIILVENDVTDVFGQISTILEENDVKYKLFFYDEDNNLVKTVSSAIVVCTSNPCIQQFIIQDTSTPFSDFDGISDFESNLLFDNSTNTFLFVWSDNTGQSASYYLNVTRRLLNGTQTVCNVTSSSLSSSLSCVVGDSRASYTAEAFRLSDGRFRRIHLLTNKVGDLSSIFDTEGLFWSFILLGTMIAIGIFYPPVGVIFYLTGLFMLSLFDIIYLNPAIIVAQVVIGVAFIWAFRG